MSGDLRITSRVTAAATVNRAGSTTIPTCSDRASVCDEATQLAN